MALNSGNDREHDELMAKRYREAANESPPVRLDAAIRAAARREAGAGPRPLIVYGPGTQGLADQCAPSRQFNQGIHFANLNHSSALTRRAGQPIGRATSVLHAVPLSAIRRLQRNADVTAPSVGGKDAQIHVTQREVFRNCKGADNR